MPLAAGLQEGGDTRHRQDRAAPVQLLVRGDAAEFDHFLGLCPTQPRPVSLPRQQGEQLSQGPHGKRTIPVIIGNASIAGVKRPPQGRIQRGRAQPEGSKPAAKSVQHPIAPTSPHADEIQQGSVFIE
ncbi:hypothetical protein D1872_265750 [compost metagenome]